jgi:hypothetical protein
MAEKVIGEIRFIETDDGFRVEVKGDKERLRQMGCPPNMGTHGMGASFMGLGPGKHFWRRRWRGGRHGRGHRHHGPPPGEGFGPWGWWDWWSDEMDEDDNDDEMPPKGV